jgi:hypothetical protein
MAPKNGPQPGIPQINDLSQVTAEEQMDRATREAEAIRGSVQRDLARDKDERFRLDEDDEAGEGNPNHDRDRDIDEVRGGDRAYSVADWDRSMGKSDPVRRAQIRRRFDEAVLPQLPKRDGWRRAWISTTHNYDTPQFRIGLGYHFCTYEQLGMEGWAVDQYAVKDARNVYAGCVMWREMIAMETDERNWYAIMRELHHDQPYEQARGIYDMIDAAGQQIRDAGGRTTMAPGMESLRAYVRPPRQFH